ncbi:MAG: phosphate ABC transporter permease subunit PstC [Verrucomicrobiota bacterium]|nr:phosphate ABC transporter permease subunit PstC [Verrucomicrobiota bacterium]
MNTVAGLPQSFAAKQRARKPRISSDQSIKLFFGSNALVAIVVLALITIFLFRDGFGFFGQNLTNIRFYRQSGLEYVDLIRKHADAHAALSRGLSTIRLRQVRSAQLASVPLENINASLASFDVFATAFSDSAEPLNGLVSDSGDLASELKAQLAARGGLIDQKADLEESGAAGEAARVNVPTVAQEQTMTTLRESTPAFEAAAATIQTQVEALLASAPELPDAGVQKAFGQWKQRAREYLRGLASGGSELRAWSPDAPVPWYRAITSFLFGRDWVTASFWQDWYGIIPLFVGSLMVSVVALAFAVPFGVTSAIYVSEVASPREKRFIKPYIEFISAIPSVVLGFFGIAVVGQAVRAASESSWFKWVSFFPLSERLNVFTAGLLLALMAVPTIFTLSEDALRNVPRGFKEASYALGANRLQTIARVLVPASLSGIVSAILLGLGRVIGETMVVLLCAGNRIAIPDFTEGLGAFFQPVHTMTGIIAQEMGEVVRGSIHYRALFMVGLVLFVLTLGINYLAQRLVARYRMSIG